MFAFKIDPGTAACTSSVVTLSSSQNFTDGVRYALSATDVACDTERSATASDPCRLQRKRCFRFFCLTGFGKSICYQVLPFLSDHKSGLAGGQKMCVIVVSPLTSLMVDQVRNLRRNDVDAVVISSGSRESSIVDKEFLATEKSLKSASLVFSSLEALTSLKWREMLENPATSNRVCAVVIDEAHCVSKWQVLSIYFLECIIFTCHYGMALTIKIITFIHVHVGVRTSGQRLDVSQRFVP